MLSSAVNSTKSVDSNSVAMIHLIGHFDYLKGTLKISKLKHSLGLLIISGEKISSSEWWFKI